MRFRYKRWRSTTAYRSGWLANRNAEPLDADPFAQNRKKKQWIRGWQDAEGALAYEWSEFLHNPPPKKSWIGGSYFLISCIVVVITYPLAIIRWFIPNHKHHVCLGYLGLLFYVVRCSNQTSFSVDGL